MRTKITFICVALAMVVASAIFTGCFAKKYAQKKVENEELKIKLAKAEENVQKLDGIVAELQSVSVNTDTIVLHTTEIKEVVRESKTTLDTIARRIDEIKQDIIEIKRRLQ